MHDRARTTRARGGGALSSFVGFVALCILCGVAGVGLAGVLVSPPPAAAELTSASAPEPEPERASTPPAPVAPRSPAATDCATTVTMSVWAHYDDDLIFMNPALGDAIAAGDCVRTVFLTGADGGHDAEYARGRELGILRAYNTMLGRSGYWIERPVVLHAGLAASQWSPEGDPTVTVVFLRLPDGDIGGGGFPSTGHVSLAQLTNGAIAALPHFDGTAAVTLDQLTGSVAELIAAYGADRLYTHVPAGAATLTAGDHSDHAATGTVARAAAERAGFPRDAVHYVVGYPSAGLEANVSGDALARKLAAFRVYAAEDRVVRCATDDECLALPRFGGWLQRHHVASDAALFPAG